MSQDVKNSLSKETVDTIFKAIQGGANLADYCGITQEQLENLYSLGFNLFNVGNFKDSLTVFEALTLYNNLDIRFWMGLGGSRQGLGDYEGAIDAYSMGATIEAFNNPEPFLYVARCFIKLGKKEEALTTLEGLIDLVDPDNPKHLECKSVAEALIELMRKKA